MTHPDPDYAEYLADDNHPEPQVVYYWPDGSWCFSEDFDPSTMPHDWYDITVLSDTPLEHISRQVMSLINL